MGKTGRRKRQRQRETDRIERQRQRDRGRRKMRQQTKTTHTHTHTHARTHTQARTHAHARTHTHARTHARTHTHTHTQKRILERYPVGVSRSDPRVHGKQQSHSPFPSPPNQFSSSLAPLPTAIHETNPPMAISSMSCTRQSISLSRGE